MSRGLASSRQVAERSRFPLNTRVRVDRRHLVRHIVSFGKPLLDLLNHTLESMQCFVEALVGIASLTLSHWPLVLRSLALTHDRGQVALHVLD